MEFQDLSGHFKMQNIDEIENLIKLISKLPGLGPKSAKRIVLKLVGNKDELVKPMASILAQVYKNVTRCNLCGSLKSNSEGCLNCENIKENTSQNFNKHEGMIVDQIKNISQEEKIRAAENDKNNNKINSFDDLIVMANNKKEMDLKYNLETNVNLVSFEKNRIKISFNEKLNTDFIKILTAKLLEWTGERWIITLTKEKGILSKKESKKRDNELLKSKFKTSEQYLKIKNLFKDAVFSDIEDETDE